MSIPMDAVDSNKPFCAPDPESGSKGITTKEVKTRIDHLDSIRKMTDALQYEPETDLEGFLMTLGAKISRPVTAEEIGHRVTMALEKNGPSWILYNLAALYWRIVGNLAQTVECLRYAIAYSDERTDTALVPGDVGDVALVSLGNVLHRVLQLNDAVVVLTHALMANSTSLLAHFAMANTLASKGDWDKAERFYASTLFYQPRFPPAEAAVAVIKCRRQDEEDRKKARKKKKVKNGSNRGLKKTRKEDSWR